VLAALRSPIGNFAVNTPVFLLPQKVHLRPKHHVLEIGCADGANLRFLASRIGFRRPPVGLDLAPGPVAAGAAFAIVRGSGSRLPFAEESFDLVLCGHLLRHLSGEGLLRLLVEAHRVLTPGGVLAIWDFAPPSGRSTVRRWMLDLLGGSGTPRDFATLAHWASEARYDVIENPDLRPFLFPPLRRVSLLARKPARDSQPPA